MVGRGIVHEGEGGAGAIVFPGVVVGMYPSLVAHRKNRYLLYPPYGLLLRVQPGLQRTSQRGFPHLSGAVWSCCLSSRSGDCDVGPDASITSCITAHSGSER